MNKWFSEKKEALLRELFSFLKFKSISADPNYKNDILSCANWLSDYLKKIGLYSDLLPTTSYPIVFARNKDYKEDKPTILIYGHYDVQPIDPLDEWNSDPFNPVIIDDKIYARGALDNKGQMFYAISAVHYFLDKQEQLPFNIKFCIEGEEETSSKGLFTSLDKHKEILKADYLFAIDFNMLDKNTPSITLGARGMVSMTAEFIGSGIDFHSGEFGGIAYNPLKACVQTLSKLWDDKGHINIPHFYDDVKEIEDRKSLPAFNKKKYEKEFSLNAFHEEEGYNNLESNWLRPTIEINGIGGGYFDVGFKSVIPRKVVCKISSRLVKNQKPDKIAKLIKEFLQKHTKKGIEVKVEINDGGCAIAANSESKLTNCLKAAMEEVFEEKCQYIYCGGSVPIISSLVEILQVEPTMMGLGLASDNMHAPNEHFSLTRFKQGFLCIAKALENFRER